MADDTLWMLIRKGHVVRHPVDFHGQKALVWPTAETSADATRLAFWFMNREGAPQDVQTARVGAVEGESLDSHIRLAIEEGCVSIICVDGWESDGSPKWKYVDLTQEL